MDSEITILISKNIRNNPFAIDIGFKSSTERFEFEKKDRPIKYHPWLKTRLKLKSNQFEFKKTITLPNEREDVISFYYEANLGRFHFNGKPLKNNSKIDTTPSISQLKNQLKKLKFDHQRDNVDTFINRFKDLIKSLELDDTATKAELLVFFKRPDQSNLFSRLHKLSVNDLYENFYSLYKDQPNYWKDYYESLEFSSAPSIERFLIDKIYYFKFYKKIVSLNSIKTHLLFQLPDILLEKINLFQPSLDNEKATINYILLRSEELNLPAVRKKDENMDLDRSYSSNLKKISYPKRGSRY